MTQDKKFPIYLNSNNNKIVNIADKMRTNISLRKVNNCSFVNTYHKETNSEYIAKHEQYIHNFPIKYFEPLKKPALPNSKNKSIISSTNKTKFEINHSSCFNDSTRTPPSSLYKYSTSKKQKRNTFLQSSKIQRK